MVLTKIREFKIFKHFSTYYNALIMLSYKFCSRNICGKIIYNPFELDYLSIWFICKTETFCI